MAMINFSPRFRGDADRAGPIPARQMKLAEALMQRKTPNAMHSNAEGVAHVADRSLAGFLAGQARRDETAAEAEAGKTIASLLLGGAGPGAGGVSADMPAPGAEPASGGGFPASLIDTESGGNWNALNNEVGAGGARGHGGRLQFGNARLEDAANAGVIPAGMTAQQFAQQPPEIQQAVENWHFSDIDREIQSRGLDQYIGQNIGGAPATLDGMRAVAHLGGIRGLERFVTSGGQYNPSDSFGTSLSDYFSRHAGNTASMANTPAQGASQASGQQGIAQALAQLHPENQQQASYASMPGDVQDELGGMDMRRQPGAQPVHPLDAAARLSQDTQQMGMPADQARRMGGMLLGPQATRQEAGISPRVPGAGRDFQNVQQTGDVAAMGGAPGAFGLTGPGVQAGPMGVTPRTPFDQASGAVEMMQAPMQAPQQRQPAPAPAPAPQGTPMQRDMPARQAVPAQGQAQPAFMQAVNDPSIDPDAYGDGQRMPRQIGNILAARSFIEQGRPVPERLQGMIEQDMQRGSPQAIGAALTGGGSQAPRQAPQAADGGMTPQQGIPPAGGAPMAAEGAPQGMSDPDAILQEALMNPRTRDVAIQVLQQRQKAMQPREMDIREVNGRIVGVDRITGEARDLTPEGLPQEQGFRMASPDEAQQYGAQAGQFGPDGRFYPINPPSGMSIETGPDGQVRIVQGSGAQAKPFTEGQSKDVVFATRARGALEAFEPVANALTDRSDRALEFDPTGFARGYQSDEFQVARNAGDEFLQAILRKDTGAAITEQEQALYGATYLPRPGDNPAVLEQKAAARRRAIAALEAGMSPAQMIAQERGLMESRAPADGSEPDPQTAPQAEAPPAPGTVIDGYRFRGGDPGDPNSWEAVR